MDSSTETEHQNPEFGGDFANLSLKPCQHDAAEHQIPGSRGELVDTDIGIDTIGKPNQNDAVEHGNGDTNQDVAVERDDLGAGAELARPNQNGGGRMIRPNSFLPEPAAPPGVARSKSLPERTTVDVPAIGSFIRERSARFSTAIAKRLSSMKDGADDDVAKPDWTEFKLSGIKVVVKLKGRYDDLLPGRITFFSRSNCRDCTAVRSFFRESGLRFVEINIDVYPTREQELRDLTGASSVPQIFFNEKLFGGLVALNSMRNSGLFEQRLKEMVGTKCPDSAPAPPVYGFDEPGEDPTDEMVGIVRVLRQRLPIQDRLMKMKIVKNCFYGGEMIDAIVQHLGCGYKEAVEVANLLVKKHFIHHVFGESEFQEGNHFYRFLEHEAFIPKCYNFRGSLNDNEPKSAATVSQRLHKLMSAILESYASQDRRHLDYIGISNSEEFRRYVNLVQDLQRVNLLELSSEERLAFFLNLYNAMVIHAVIRIGHPGDVIDKRGFFTDFHYLVGGHSYSLTAIKNGILRGNRRPPYSLVKCFGNGDKRLELAFPKVNQLIHFGLCNGTKSSPVVRFFTPNAVESELRFATREFFQRDDGMEVDLSKRTVYLTGNMKWFNMDFGADKEMLQWILNYLDASKSGLLTHLLGDNGPVRVAYKTYNWSVNS